MPISTKLATFISFTTWITTSCARAKQITEDYLPKQMKFWKDMEDTMNQLESELSVYTRLLPADNSLGHSDKSPFQQGFSQYGSPQRPTRSITRLPTSKTPERPTPSDLSCQPTFGRGQTSSTVHTHFIYPSRHSFS